MDDAGVEVEVAAADSASRRRHPPLHPAADDDSNGAKKQQRAARAAESDLRLRESTAFGAYVHGVRRVPVERHEQVLQLLSAGARRRDVAAAPSNLHSSSATSFFTLHLRNRSAVRDGPPLPTEPSLTIVDVAAVTPTPRDKGRSARAKNSMGGGGARASAGGGGGATVAARRGRVVATAAAAAGAGVVEVSAHVAAWRLSHGNH